MRFASRTFRKKKLGLRPRGATNARTRRLKQRRQRTRRFRRSNTLKGGAYKDPLGQSIPKGKDFFDSGTQSKQTDDAVETMQEVTEY